MMFERYSDRAKRIIFLARMKAGQRGAGSIDVKHVIEALVLEDQGEFAKMMPNAGAARRGPSLAPSRSYLSAASAANFLEALDGLSSAGEPIPTSTDMPITDALKSILDATIALTDETHRSTIQPLDILAATIEEDTTGVAQILVDSGLSSEDVVAAIKSGDFD
jgi:ATP-dependent Clp protease ATP-binding subunit ClpC